ncbi:phosphoadenosine phosphosulfate reductase family protein [Anaerobacterium chartisolvens]|uniref:Phosphoadenosine phosphosulfate reductase family protein n=1 Tax=Anaerobacterium chartisolvens TaxID=1297424 RepID=A0A369BMJ5_9FIRM|nr:phosphoadenosine phosphosulfate reductase family protein [Anaerobacterium chartisolvens]RCX20904.1 phosphoadenosine phosphosulfate reductase family protein [Anaerobacterium chartisolvens]
MYISYEDLTIEQNKDLDYKIAEAVKAIAAALKVCRHRCALAFSGGKDSTVLWHIIRTHFPETVDRLVVIYGNTGIEYPECLKFSRQLPKDWKCNFCEATPLKTECPCYKYKAQQEILQHVINQKQLNWILKEDGKLKSTATLEAMCPPHLQEKFERERLIWPEGTTKSYWWCTDQYGWPLLGKAFSRLKAHRINIDCFLRYSKSQSEDAKLLAYYEILSEVKISQACCDILKKEPSEKVQADYDVDVIFKGLMAAESRSRQTNFISRGYLFKSSRPHLEKSGDPFWHCNPISIWTDDDIWKYIHRFNVPYSTLYDMGWTDADGKFHKIKRNGCMGCGTDLLFQNNHMAMLRRTHQKQWEAIMRKGMAAEIQKLQIAKRNGQPSLFDVLQTTEELLDTRPCIFDRVDRLVLKDDTWIEAEPDFDPDSDEIDIAS